MPGKPNGLAISPDQKSLYVVCHDNGTFYGALLAPEIRPRKGRMALLAYDLDPEGMPKFREELVNYAPGDGPDGLAVDVEGNLYVAVRDERRPGIYIYFPSGQERAYVPTESLPTNVGFRPGQRDSHPLRHRRRFPLPHPSHEEGLPSSAARVARMTHRFETRRERRGL